MGLGIGSIDTLISVGEKCPLKDVNLKKATMFLNGKVYNSKGRFVDQPLFFENGRIITSDQFVKAVNKSNDCSVVDLQGDYVTPAILDQHIHGGYGIDFNTASEDEIRMFLREIKRWGNSEILATMVPGTIEHLNNQMDIIRKIIRNPEKNAAKIIGINLEGPFFSPKKAGIHPQQILLTPTVDNVNKLNLDDVKMFTIAPELDEGYKTTEYLQSKGIVVSAGHSDADAQTVRDSGVTQVTHLFNAMRGFHHRIPSIANEGLLNDSIYAEVNSAIELLDPATVELIAKTKPKDKVILISDALNGTNIKGDHFYMGGKRIDIDEDGIAKDKDGILAGSIKLLGQVVRRLVDTTHMTFSDFIKFASENPARNLKVENDYKLNRGLSPNFVVWNKSKLTPERTFIKGE